MALKPADMEDCSPKKKCVGGPNDGIAYTPGDECADGYVFNIATCDCDLDGCPQCDSRGNTSYLITFDYQKHDTAPCDGFTLDPCDSGGACPTTIEPSVTVPIFIGGPAFSITSFVEKQRYGASNPYCPANVEPINVTWNEAYGFGVDKVFSDGEVYDGNSTDGFIGGLSNSLWALATDENGLTWAIYVHSVWFGSINSTYRAGGYFDISATPSGTFEPLPTCPSGQVWDCETCQCEGLILWQFDGTYTDSFGGTGIISSQFELTSSGYAIVVGDDSLYWDGGYSPDDFDQVTRWTNSATLTRNGVFCSGGNTTGIGAVYRQTSSSGFVFASFVPGTTLQTLCSRPEGTPVSLSGVFTEVTS